MSRNPFHVLTRIRNESVSSIALHYGINKLVAARLVRAREYRPLATCMINRSHIVLVDNLRDCAFAATVMPVWRVWMARLDNERILLAAHAEIKQVVWEVFENERTIVEPVTAGKSDYERDVFAFNKSIDINVIR